MLGRVPRLGWLLSADRADGGGKSALPSAGEQAGGYRPEVFGAGWFEGPRFHAVGVICEFGVVGHGVGFLAVVEVVASGVREFRSDCCHHARGGTLLDRLVGEDAGSSGGVERLLLLRGEVALQSGRHAAGWAPYRDGHWA